ncbi:FtsQ-type POTRA domain-containing protein [Sphingobacteriaceae bacterium WQ 2009]|uniref:FtsQ-type POTRA domain-containing protein n=1 Tax=Rhinopithecimicrobium faecis TaxID=2820698 RepID=A0A8T4HAD0_9SPHI|nr:FtsQ-type POTRA domain-containing protein [Sphingobacteriaceae bacterium WQ 2009]
MLNWFRNIRWRLIFIAILGIGSLIGVIFLMIRVDKQDQNQLCTDLNIFIEGKESFIDQDDISSLIALKYGRIVGRELNLIKTQEIEKSLKALPYVAEASVHLDMSGEMRINLTQREVVMRVVNRLGTEYYLDQKGLKVPTTLKYVPRVLIASGNIAEGYKEPLEAMDSKLLKDLFQVVNYINNDELWSNQVVQIYVNQNDDIELVPRIGDQQLIIGTADSLDQKFELLQVFYKNIMPKVGIEAYEKVNVKYAGQIICEKRGDWSFDGMQKSAANKEEEIKVL